MAVTASFSMVLTAPVQASDKPGDVTESVTTRPADARVILTHVALPNNVDACGRDGINSDAEYSHKIDAPTGSTHSLPGGASVTVTGNARDGYTIEMSGGVLADVLLKSDKQNNNWYAFDPSVTYATPLYAPGHKDLSHITFCYDVATTLSIVKDAAAPAISIGDAFGYQITVTNTGSIDAVNAVVTDSLIPDGHDWAITAQNATACVLSDSSADTDTNVDDLRCTFDRLAAGASYTVSVATTETDGGATTADCDQTYRNIAFASADNAPQVSDDAAITVQCGGLAIVKTAKHKSSDTSSRNLVAGFTVVDADGVTHTVSTNAEGFACVSNLPLGTATVTETAEPAGYADNTTVETVTVTDADCGTTGVATASFENIPLTNISWTVDSQVQGATQTLVQCWDANGTLVYSNSVSDGTASFNDLLPTDPNVTLRCDFTVDP